jgi:hypothetical protein
LATSAEGAFKLFLERDRIMATKTTKTTQATTDADNGTAAVRRTKCPITREQFAKDCKPILITLKLPGTGDRQLVLAPKQFQTGSVGWHCNEKIVLVIDGVPAKVQANIGLTVVGSKEL